MLRVSINIFNNWASSYYLWTFRFSGVAGGPLGITSPGTGSQCRDIRPTNHEEQLLFDIGKRVMTSRHRQRVRTALTSLWTLLNLTSALCSEYHHHPCLCWEILSTPQSMVNAANIMCSIMMILSGSKYETMALPSSSMSDLPLLIRKSLRSSIIMVCTMILRSHKRPLGSQAS